MMVIKKEGELKCGAGNEIRTRDLNLGKVALYQLSYSRTLFRAERGAYFMACEVGVKSNDRNLLQLAELKRFIDLLSRPKRL